MSSLGPPTRVPCGPLPKLTHGSTVFRCFLRSSGRLTPFHHTQSFSLSPPGQCTARGMQPGYSEADNSAVKLDLLKFLGLSSDAHPINTLFVRVHCFYEAML